MMKIYRYLTAILVLSSALGAYAQQTVAGRVTDGSDGSGLPGVNIVERGTSNGSLAAANGNYSITVSPDAGLVYSFVGFQTQELAVGGRATVNEALHNDGRQAGDVGGG